MRMHEGETEGENSDLLFHLVVAQVVEQIYRLEGLWFDPWFPQSACLVVFEVFLRDDFHYDFGSLATIVADIHTTN